MEARVLPFPRLQYALRRIQEAIPLHIEQLRAQSDRLPGLRSDQLKAANTVRLLKQDLFELEELARQVKEEDFDRFHAAVEGPLKEAVDALTTFMEVHSDVLGPLLELDTEQVELPTLNITQSSPGDPSPELPPENPPPQLQIEASKGETADAWSFLRKELQEVQALMRHFSLLVFSQQEHVDTIQANVLQAHENVHQGTASLKKASLLKAASFPLAGALLGGALLGPVGLLAGLKLAGCMGLATGGGILGYAAGTRVRTRHQNALQAIEMKPISKSLPNLPKER